MRFIFCICFFLGQTFLGFSQVINTSGNCKIKGRVIDSVSGQPVGYATVTAFLKGDSKVAGGIITDDKGAFTIDQLLPGNYELKIDFLGYRTKTIQGITLTESQPVYKTGDQLISSGSKNIKEVTVTGSRNFMENQLDKFVFNVEKDITSQGGTATDILLKMPQVMVDVDGNVGLLGNSNIRIFINGRPSSMFDNNPTEALKSIPASQIEKIEIITSPGAQYEAQGTGGIINIILKGNDSKGVNGSITLNGGTRLENGSANINVKKGAIDFNATLSGNEQLKSATLNTLDRIAFANNSETVQNGNVNLERNGYRGQVGFGWAMTKNDNLTASLNYNNIGNSNAGTTNQDLYYNNRAIDTATARNSDNTFRYGNVDVNLNYLKKFKKKGRELNIGMQSGIGKGNTYYDESQRYTDSLTLLNGAMGHNHLTDKESWVMTDFTNPVGKDVILNTGVKGSFSRITSNSDHYIDSSGIYNYDPSQYNNFNYNRDVYAAYVSLTFPLAHDYSLKMGMRDEYTNIARLSGMTSDPSYNFFIPSMVISRKLNKDQTIKISYTKRIQRSSYKDLNPFIDATDPSSLLQGNPFLKPERTDVVEFSYYRVFEKGSSILITAFSRDTRDDEQTYVYDTTFYLGNTFFKNVAITTNENAGHQYLNGLNISGSLSVSKKLELRGNINIFDKYIVSELVPGTTINSLNYRSSLNATFQFNKTLIAECFGNFNSPRTEIQGKFPSFTTYSLALRKFLMKKKASMAFTTTDPFNKYVNQPTNITGTNFKETADRQIPYRSFGLSFSYKFGKMEFKEKKPDHDPNFPEEGN